MFLFSCIQPSLLKKKLHHIFVQQRKFKKKKILTCILALITSLLKSQELGQYFKKNLKKVNMDIAPDITSLSNCRTRHHGGPQNISRLWKKNRFWHLVLLGKKVLSKESPPSIMVTRNPNWSIEILWLGIGYVKGKILSPLKRSA